MSYLKRFTWPPLRKRRAAEAESPGVDDAPDVPSEATSGADWRARVRVGASWTTTALAFLLVWFALVAPNELSRLTPGAFLRIPIEGLVIVVLALVLPPRARPFVAVPVGVVLGLLADREDPRHGLLRRTRPARSTR